MSGGTVTCECCKRQRVKGPGKGASRPAIEEELAGLDLPPADLLDRAHVLAWPDVSPSVHCWCPHTSPSVKGTCSGCGYDVCSINDRAINRAIHTVGTVFDSE